MTDEKKPAEPKAVTDEKAAFAHRITRRRFTKAGAVAPIVMTLGSRSVWGADCAASISGQQSGNASHAMSEAPGSEGHPPSWWLVSIENWPTGNTTQIASKTGNTTTPSGAQVKISDSPYKGNFTAYRIESSLKKLTGCGSTDSLYGTLARGDHDPGAEAAAAMLNALTTTIDYGYMPDAIASFICAGHPEDVACVLEGLNRRRTSVLTRNPVSGVNLKIGNTNYITLGAYYNVESPQRLVIVVQ